MSKFKIAKQGKELTSDNPEDFIFNSDFPTLCIKERGSVSLTTNAGNDPEYATATYNHNFGYIPFFMAFATSYLTTQSDKFTLAEFMALDIDLTVNLGASWIRENLYAIIDEGKIEFSGLLEEIIPQFEGEGIAYTYNIHFILFMEEIKLT